MKGRKPHMVAAIEALEEAGLEGKVSKKSVGAYHYIKRMRNGAGLLCEVGVFPLRVAKQRKKWRERGQRVTKWFDPATAAELVHEPELQELILNFAAAAPIAPKDEESLAPEPATPLERSE
jgi:8-oxo-dGTP pyrophosphatase MutT (NUDIX family)